MIIKFLILVLFVSLEVGASLLLILEGKVVSMDEHSVTLQNNATMIQVPRCSVQAKNIRPGQWISATIDSKEKVKTWAANGLRIGGSK